MDTRWIQIMATKNEKIQFRVRPNFSLSSSEVKIIILKARKLYEIAEFPPEAQKILDDNPDLAEALKKW